MAIMLAVVLISMFCLYQNMNVRPDSLQNVPREISYSITINLKSKISLWCRIGNGRSSIWCSTQQYLTLSNNIPVACISFLIPGCITATILHTHIQIYTYARTHTRIHLEINTYSRILYTHSRTHTCTHSHARTRSYARAHTHTQIHTYARKHTIIHIYIHTYSRIYIYTHSHTNTHACTKQNKLVTRMTQCWWITLIIKLYT